MTETSSLAWPKCIYAFSWMKKKFRFDHNSSSSFTKPTKGESICEMSGKLVLDQIGVEPPNELNGCEYCYKTNTPFSSYSGKLVCHKCATFRKIPQI